MKGPKYKIEEEAFLEIQKKAKKGKNIQTSKTEPKKKIEKKNKPAMLKR